MSSRNDNYYNSKSNPNSRWNQNRSEYHSGNGWGSSNRGNTNGNPYNSNNNYNNYNNNNTYNGRLNVSSSTNRYPRSNDSSSSTASYHRHSYQKRDGSGNYKYTQSRQPPPPKAKADKPYYGPVLSNLDQADPKVLQVKTLVDQHLHSISQETWNDHSWTHKILSQLPHPDFTRDYKVSSIETISSLALSLQTMEDKLEEYIPRDLLIFNSEWWNKKVHIAAEIATYVQGHQEFLLDPNNILAFFRHLPYNLIFDAGFHALGITTMDEKMCYCPCGYKMKAWHRQFQLQFLHQNSRDDYCSDRKFKHIDLMFHIDTVAKLENVHGLIHRGLHRYLTLLYQDCNGGRGHKALYHIGDKNYKDIEAYERRSMERLKEKLLQQLALEEEKRLDIERAREELEQELKDRGLEYVNKDKFDQIHDLSKNLHDMALEVHEKKSKTKEELELARRDMESIFQCLYSKRKSKDLTVPSQFRLQQLMDTWYDCPDTDEFHLFQPIVNSDTLNKFLCEWRVNFEESMEGVELLTKIKGFQTLDNGGPTAQFLSNIWKQLGDLTVKVNGKSVKLFEPTKGGLVMVTEDVFTDKDMNGSPQGMEETEKPSFDMVKDKIFKETNYQSSNDRLLVKPKLWYRAIGRIMIHSLMGKNDNKAQRQFPIPSFVMPRFYRNVIFRGCGPEDKSTYDWAEVVNDLRDIELGSAIDHFIEEKKDAKDEIFTQLIPEYFIKSRKAFIEAFREGITIGGIIDHVGHMLKDIPLSKKEKWVFTPDQLDSLVNMSSRKAISLPIPPYFKSYDLDILDGIVFAKSSVTVEDICKLLRVRLWGFDERRESMVSHDIINDQKRLFEQMKSVFLECCKEDADFPSRFIEFFTGFAYPPSVKESDSDVAHPSPDPEGKNFEITVEFNGEHIVDPESLPVAHTCAKMMMLPGTAYNGDSSVFKRKLLESLRSLPTGMFGMK